eukprot:CAMPEP_0176389642 /NCGR_PEP_ID=MMETSP0126-20121128/38534_1 /TAXON_ID=141414 ORGANISM="Strombidinopsis acuminatum, Strain SPMC142" /NCGR_SAMPLE_ID=MMETSP0126 /ASSEMBLY_ACC=CAM_ASM_000229 /LENGTH=71 /DNA_ID=CAMNT_0017758567 /DNA_START=139 /DNA_END=354 /DNA_ORIENTATION=-
MPGGGPWGLTAGQVTDDSELAMCLMNGLVEGNGKLDPKYICKYYGKWYQSNTTANGINMAHLTSVQLLESD